MIEPANALQLARDAFSGSTSYFDANIRPELERDLRQFQSKHPNGSKYLSDSYKGRSRFFRPKTRAMVRSGEASVAEAFFTTLDVVAIEPLNTNNEFAKAAGALNLGSGTPGSYCKAFVANGYFAPCSQPSA